MKDNKINRFVAVKLFMLFFSVYFFTSSGVNLSATDAGQLRLGVVNSIVERADLSVPYGISGIKGSDGRTYSWVGIGSALLAVPFYIGARTVGLDPENAVSIMNQLFGAATVVVIFLFSISLGYSRKASLLAAILYGLGTMAWPMTKQPFDHPVEVFFTLLCFYFIYLYVVKKTILLLFLSALAFGLTYITRTTSILVMPSLFIFLILYYLKTATFKTAITLTARSIGLFTLVFLPFLGLDLWYNHYRFGSVFETGYSVIAASTGVSYFTGTSMLTGVRGFLLSPGKGFFYYSPVTILFFFAIKAFIKKHPALGISFMVMMISYLLFLSKYVFWHGDWAWGPRYIFVLVPFSIIPLCGLLDSSIWLRKGVRLVVYSIFILSVVIQIVAVSVDFQKYFAYIVEEKNVRFTVWHGDGVQPIKALPSDVYFDWNMSPILQQIVFVSEIAAEMKDHVYLKPSEDIPPDNKSKIQMGKHVFDFWWVYKYFIDGSKAGFAVALILLVIAVSNATVLWKVARDNFPERLRRILN